MPNLQELIARVLCDVEGRNPDFERYGVAAWKRHVATADMIINAIDAAHASRKAHEAAMDAAIAVAAAVNEAPKFSEFWGS
jgi:hypothetical protein